MTEDQTAAATPATPAAVGVPAVDSATEAGELTTGTPTAAPQPPDKPTRDDPKAAWLAWARDRGYDLPDGARTKDQLIAEYGA